MVTWHIVLFIQLGLEESVCIVNSDNPVFRSPYFKEMNSRSFTLVLPMSVHSTLLLSGRISLFRNLKLILF